MNLTVAIALAACVAVCLALELRGVPTTLRLSFKGDVKRETAFLAQYGQSVATPVAGWLVAIAAGQGALSWSAWRAFALVCGPVLMTSLSCAVLKRTLGRRRPNRDRAGAFTGPSWRHDNARESFPSSHSACAFALSVALARAWPEAAPAFWTFATLTALLRYVLDAHFPSDVLAGSLLGLATGGYAWGVLDGVLPAG